MSLIIDRVNIRSQTGFTPRATSLEWKVPLPMTGS